MSHCFLYYNITNEQKMGQLLENFLYTNEKDDFQAFLQKKYNDKRIERSFVKRFFELEKTKQNKILDKTIEKYNSDEYINRWEKRSMEPENKLWWILFDYMSVRYECESINAYSVEYVVNNIYHIVVDFGQGSHIYIYKKNLNTI